MWLMAILTKSDVTSVIYICIIIFLVFIKVWKLKVKLHIAQNGKYLMKLTHLLPLFIWRLFSTMSYSIAYINGIYCKRIELGFKIKQNVANSKYIFLWKVFEFLIHIIRLIMRPLYIVFISSTVLDLINAINSENS